MWISQAGGVLHGNNDEAMPDKVVQPNISTKYGAKDATATDKVANHPSSLKNFISSISNF
jgi:hypothetical protein